MKIQILFEYEISNKLVCNFAQYYTGTNSNIYMHECWRHMIGKNDKFHKFVSDFFFLGLHKKYIFSYMNSNKKSQHWAYYENSGNKN